MLWMSWPGKIGSSTPSTNNKADHRQAVSDEPRQNQEVGKPPDEPAGQAGGKAPAEEFEPRLEPCPSASRFAGHWAIFVLGFVVMGLLWSAVREGASEQARVVSDLSFSGFFAAVPLFIAFRMLYRYSFRLSELILLVWLLAAGATATVWSVEDLAQLKLVSLDTPERTGSIHLLRVMQYCFLTNGLLLFGGVLGLHYCRVLKLEKTRERLTAVAAGTLIVPALVGVFAFPTFLFGTLMMPDGWPERAAQLERAPWYVLLWVLSCGLSFINLKHLLGVSALKIGIGEKESGES